MYNNVYNAGFYPHMGMGLGFHNGFAVNQVPPAPEHAAHESGGIKLTTALEGLAALGTAALVYKVTKGKLHNIKPKTAQTAAETVEEGTQKVTSDDIKRAVNGANENTALKRPKGGPLTHLNNWLEADMYSPEELQQIWAQRAQGKGPEGPMTTILKMPYYAVKAVVMAPIDLAKGTMKLFKGKNAQNAATESLQAATASSRREAALQKIAQSADLGSSGDTIILGHAKESAQTAADEATTKVDITAWKPEGQ